MDLRNQRGSGNIEDRRGQSRGKGMAIGGIGTLILAAIVFFMGGDPTSVLDLSSAMQAPQESTTQPSQNDAEYIFVDRVLGSTEEVWTQEFRKMGGQYRPPILVMFRGQTMSQCGGAHSATGPFYCPLDKKIYLDYSFFDQLRRGYGAKGDFANAYVIGHEVAHYVQDMMGISRKVQSMQRRSSKKEANRLSVKLELQADFLAGYWARRAKNLNLSENDIRSALSAANAIGDDRLQKQSQGYVVPDAFTHGTSQQRMEWFMKGFNAQSINEGNTFQEL